MDPIHQFEIKKLFPIAHIGGMEIAFTNSALFMLIGLLLILLLMLGATSSRALVPGRLQSVAAISYEFVATTLRSTAGTAHADAGYASADHLCGLRIHEKSPFRGLTGARVSGPGESHR